MGWHRSSLRRLLCDLGVYRMPLLKRNEKGYRRGVFRRNRALMNRDYFEIIESAEVPQDQLWFTQHTGSRLVMSPSGGLALWLVREYKVLGKITGLGAGLPGEGPG